MGSVFGELEKKLSGEVAIVTTTFYRHNNLIDEAREKLARRTIREATKRGYKVIVMDYNSPKDTLDFFTNCGAEIHKRTEEGMGAARREAIKYAVESGLPIVAWTEPEKVPYIPELIKTVAPIFAGQAEMVIPRRVPVTLKHYSNQQYSELLGNAFFHKLTGLDLDVWFGPRTWSKELSHYFLDYHDKTYGDKWDSIFVPLVPIIKEGHRIVSVNVDYIHPPEQALLEDNDLSFYRKRVEQLDTLFRALETYWRK